MVEIVPPTRMELEDLNPSEQNGTTTARRRRLSIDIGAARHRGGCSCCASQRCFTSTGHIATWMTLLCLSIVAFFGLIVYLLIAGNTADQPINVQCYSCEERKETGVACSKERTVNGSACVKYALIRNGEVEYSLRTAAPSNYFRRPLLSRHFGITNFCSSPEKLTHSYSIECLCITDLCNAASGNEMSVGVGLVLLPMLLRYVL